MVSIKLKHHPDFESMSVDECAVALKKDLLASGLPSIRVAAAMVGINYNTAKHYFEGHRKPPRGKWEALTTLLRSKPGTATRGLLQKPSETDSSLPRCTTNDAVARRATLLKYSLALALDHLEFFKCASPKDRTFLKEVLPGKEVGYFTGLISSLYDEEQLKAWRLFSE